MQFLILVMLFYILPWLLVKLVNKILGIEKKEISETSGKILYRWTTVAIIVAFFVTSPTAYEHRENLKWFTMLFVILFLGSQSFFEWKYIKNSKQFITTIIVLIVSMLFLYNLDFFLHFYKQN